MDGILLGPGPLAKAVTRPYDSSITRSYWKVYQFCTKDGKIYRFAGDDSWTSSDLDEGEEWTPSHWTEVKLTDAILSDLDAINQRLDNADFGSGTGGSATVLDTDLTIATTDWTLSNSVYTYTYTSALITTESAIDVIYDSSFRTALNGDIEVSKTNGSVTFMTNLEPKGTLTCVLRIFGSSRGSGSYNILVFEDVSFSIAANDWTGSEAPYTASITDSALTSTSGIWVFWDSSYYTNMTDAVTAQVVTDNGTTSAVFSTNTKPSGTISGYIRIVDCINGTVPISRGGTGATTAEDARVNLGIATSTMREVPISIGVADWTGSGTSWTAEFESEYITETSKEIVTFDSSAVSYAKSYISSTKTSGGGGLTFSATAKPTGTITGTALVWDNDDGKVPTIIEDTVVSIANGGTGQSTVAGARTTLGIGDLATLNTTAKTDLVSAINENYDQLTTFAKVEGTMADAINTDVVVNYPSGVSKSSPIVGYVVKHNNIMYSNNPSITVRTDNGQVKIRSSESTWLNDEFIVYLMCV